MIFKFVLNQDIDINARDDFNLPHHGYYGGSGRSILHKIVDCGSVKGSRPQNVAIFLSNCQGRNINWNAQDDNGDTPVIWILKNISYCKMINKRNRHHVKALKTFLEAADTLLDFHKPNRVGDTALKYVEELDDEIFLAVKKHVIKHVGPKWFNFLKNDKKSIS